MNPKKLGFGLMRLPLTDSADSTSIDHEAVCQMADSFLEAGFTYFDTAAPYHNSHSETAFRECVAKRYPRNAYTITNKLSLFMVQKAEELENFFAGQLERCGVDYFDYYLLHAMNKDYLDLAEKIGAFDFAAQKKAEGKIKHVGFSFHSSAEVLDEILTKHPEMEYVQLQLNYIDWEDEEVQSRKCYEVCVKHDKPVIVMEPVKGGSLANVPEEAERLFREKQPELSTASWGIRFAASLPHVLVVLSGMSNMEQVEDNTSYMADFQPLTPDELDTVKQVAGIIRSQITVDCAACGACTAQCPKNIPMAAYFDMYNEHCQMGKYSNGMVYYANFPTGTGKASECDGCGKCETVCPKKLPIRELLGEVKSAFEWSMV